MLPFREIPSSKLVSCYVYRSQSVHSLATCVLLFNWCICPCSLHIVYIIHILCTEALIRKLLFKRGAFKNFATFTGKHLGWSLFLIKFIYRTPPMAASIHVTFHVSSFTSLLPRFHYFLTVLLLSSFELTLSSLCHYYYTWLIS